MLPVLLLLSVAFLSVSSEEVIACEEEKEALQRRVGQMELSVAQSLSCTSDLTKMNETTLQLQKSYEDLYVQNAGTFEEFRLTQAKLQQAEASLKWRESQ